MGCPVPPHDAGLGSAPPRQCHSCCPGAGFGKARLAGCCSTPRLGAMRFPTLQHRDGVRAAHRYLREPAHLPPHPAHPLPSTQATRDYPPCMASLGRGRGLGERSITHSSLSSSPVMCPSCTWRRCMALVPRLPSGREGRTCTSFHGCIRWCRWPFLLCVRLRSTLPFSCRRAYFPLF